MQLHQVTVHCRDQLYSFSNEIYLEDKKWVILDKNYNKVFIWSYIPLL